MRSEIIITLAETLGLDQMIMAAELCDGKRKFLFTWVLCYSL